MKKLNQDKIMVVNWAHNPLACGSIPTPGILYSKTRENTAQAFSMGNRGV